ncbi:MAG: hypothetical protein JNK23_03210 [Opitutaceae bacterium]|nr:hypothetical protein [Opitutaceae bacterium]
MQLANSTTLPTDPNLLALMFCGAMPAQANGVPAMPGEGAGFAELLSEFAPAAGESSPVETPMLDLSLGVPLAYQALPGKGTNAPAVTSSEIGEAPDILPATGEGEAPAVSLPAKSDTVQTKRSGRSRPASASCTGAPELPETASRADAPAKLAEATPPQAQTLTLPLPLSPESVAFATVAVVDLPDAVIEEDVATSEETFSDDTDETSTGAQHDARSADDTASEPLGPPLRSNPVAPAATPKIDAERPVYRADKLPLTKELPVTAMSVFGDKLVDQDASEIPIQQPGMRLPTELLPSMVERRTSFDFRPMAASPNDREKVAAAVAELSDELTEGFLLPEKTFVSNASELVAKPRQALGIGVANSTPTMPASNSYPTSQTPAHDVTTTLIAAPGGLAERVESHNVLGLQLDGVSSAHEAVEVVLRTADRLSSLVHKSVRLEFSVGGEALDVRVELRSNEIRTTFHTESAELRTALASEWQTVAASAGSGERTLRILPAQFGSSDSGANGFSGDSSQRQRDAHAQAQAEAAHSFSFGGRGRSSRSTRGAAAVPVVAAAFAAPGTALHLHTLA